MKKEIQYNTYALYNNNDKYICDILGDLNHAKKQVKNIINLHTPIKSIITRTYKNNIYFFIKSTSTPDFVLVKQ